MPIVEEEAVEDPQEENEPGDDEEKAAERAKNAAILAEAFRGQPPVDQELSTEKNLTKYRNLRIANLISSSNLVLAETSGTDAALGATIQELSQKISAMENTLGMVTGSMISSWEADLESAIDVKQLEERLEPIQAELTSMRDEVVPQLKSTQSTIRRVESFIERNAEFLAASLEYQEKLSLVQSEYKSLQKRVANIEAALDKSWDRRLTIISASTAAISLFILAYVTFIR